MKTSRQYALEALSKVTDLGSYSNITIDKVLNKSTLDQRDKKLATALFYGTLERIKTLDYCINAYSNKKTEKITPEILNILRLSLYQILYMDNIPNNAAVNEGVNLTKIVKKTSAGGFVNGILRNFLRDGGEVPQIKGDLSYRLSIEYSCEIWLCERFLKSFGEEKTREILSSTAGTPPIFLRVNTIKTTDDDLINLLNEENITALKTDIKNCLKINGGDILNTKAFANGLFHIQDMSSQICCATLNPNENDIIADVCAAPGGKSFTIAEIMNNKGKIYSMDLHEKRVKLIENSGKRLGITNIYAKAQDATVYCEDMGEFDKILCDVPCSGFGIIRRKPEIKYKKQAEIQKLPEIQYKILENAAKYLKQGGELVYSTCTLLDEENLYIVDKFLKENKNFEPVFIYEDKYYKTFLPTKDGNDGFFISKIRRIK